MNMRLKPHQEAFIRAAFNKHGEIVTRQQILALCEAKGLEHPHWLTSNQKYHGTARATYILPLDRLPDLKPKTARKQAPVGKADPAATEGSKPRVAVGAATALETSDPALDPSLAFNGGKSLVPDRLDIYVPWGHHDLVSKIVASGAFYPVYITGLSGNGKTTTVEQVCAEQGREFFRVNINEETDEDDLLGGFRLINGNTVFQYGPVVEAMRRGAVLLLDEVDLGKGKIMCLQSVLEGKGVYLKKINQWIHPTAGFQVFLTGNTKGQGSGEHDDKFIGTNILNEAFLDRIPVMIDQAYPPIATEKKILGKVVTKHCGQVDDEARGFIENLAKWAEIVRRTFDEGAIDDIITTRRLIQIVQGYCILGDRKGAIRGCITRFDRAVQDSFLSLYEKIEGEPDASTPAAAGAPDATNQVVPSNADVRVSVSFQNRLSVKGLGASWNVTEKCWYFRRATWNALSTEVRADVVANYSPTWILLDPASDRIVSNHGPVSLDTVPAIA